MLYENSDYGKDLLHGLQRGLGKRASRIVAKQSYEVTDTDVNSQIAKLRRSKADTFMLFALPYQTIQSFVYAYKLGWQPQFFVSAVSIEPIDHGRRARGHERQGDGRRAQRRLRQGPDLAAPGARTRRSRSTGRS